MSPLGDLFDEAEGRAARAAADAWLTGDALGSVHTRVRRAHARRAALRTGLVAVAVVVVGAAVLLGTSWLRPLPVATPGPSGTPTPTATPTPTLTPTGDAWPGFAGVVTESTHLPDASPVTPEVWAAVGPGWVLVSYREAWASGEGPEVIYLVSPQGQRYELTTVAGDTVSVVAWKAGATNAVVSVQPDGDAPYLGIVDLTTGAVAPVDGYAPAIWSVAFLDADGHVVWTGNDGTAGHVSIGPDGTQSAFDVPAASGAAQLARDRLGFTDCGVVAPYDSTSVLVQCGSDGASRVAIVSPADGTVTELGTNATGPTRVGSHVVAATGSPDGGGCPSQYSVISGVMDAVPGWDASLHPDASSFMPFGATGDVLVWGVASACSVGESPIVVVSSDLEHGSGSVLVPYPADEPAGEQPYRSVTGVAVGR